MRKNWLLIAIGLLVAVLAIGAVACNDDGDDNGDGEAVPTATVEPVDGDTTDAGLQISMTLSEVGGSGVSGSVTITDAAGATLVVVTVDGGLEEGTHMNHIHGGSCDDVGSIAVPLTELDAAADGSASATSTITDNPDAELGHLEEGGHVVAVHALDGSIVACGDVEAG